MVREIPLTQGHVALVDDEDYEFLSQFKWCADTSYGTLYAIRQSQGKSQRLHQLLLPDFPHVDHINGDGLDNRKHNLRGCSASQNLMNRGKQSNNTSGFKGVSWHKVHNKWVAQIKVNGKGRTLGYYGDAVTAAKHYDEAATQLHGEFAFLNFPEEVSLENRKI